MKNNIFNLNIIIAIFPTEVKQIPQGNHRHRPICYRENQYPTRENRNGGRCPRCDIIKNHRQHARGAQKDKMLRIAFYGKGGIGKSTVAAHLSAAFARMGKRVLHIGCDPKADSTRCLTSGRIPTVLETLGRSEELLAREQLVFPGAFGISCVEAGGPQAGAGCAGLGITAMADELNRLGILEEPWDVVVYDVLGDVVCGGFAVPMRKHFVDRVYLITSADFMALYAANNIMRGVARYSGTSPLLGGLIQNRSRGAGEEALVRSFAEQSGARVVGILPEDRLLRRADYLHATVHHLEPEGAAAMRFLELAQRLWDTQPTSPRPLGDEALEAFCRRAAEQEVEGLA